MKPGQSARGNSLSRPDVHQAKPHLPGRPVAPHVQAALSRCQGHNGGVQRKAVEGERPVAPHVQAALGRPHVQNKISTVAPVAIRPALAPHVQAAVTPPVAAPVAKALGGGQGAASLQKKPQNVQPTLAPHVQSTLTRSPEPAATGSRVSTPVRRPAAIQCASEARPAENLQPGDEIEWYEEGELCVGVIVGFDDGRPLVRVTVMMGEVLSGEDASHYENYKVYARVNRRGGVQQVRRLNGPVTMRHYHRPADPVSAAEYVVPRGNVTITNHGLGSGIYGVLPTPRVLDVVYADAVYDEITLNNPLFLQDNAHGQLFTRLSKRLQELATAMIADLGGFYPSRTQVWRLMEEHIDLTRETIQLIDKVFSRVGRQVLASPLLSTALTEFFQEYQTASNHARQPINFLMTRLGYDGVYADNDSDNAFNRGLVRYSVGADVVRTTHEQRH